MKKIVIFAACLAFLGVGCGNSNTGIELKEEKTAKLQTPPAENTAPESPKTEAGVYPEEWELSENPENTIVIDEEILFPILTKKNSDSISVTPILQVNELEAVLAWAECEEGGTCEGYAGKITRGDKPKLLSKTRLPEPLKPWDADGIRFANYNSNIPLGIGLYDADKDNIQDFIVAYSVVEKPRPAVGSKFLNNIAIFRTKNMDKVWSFAIEKSSQAETDEKCVSSVSYFRNGCKKTRDIIVSSICNKQRYCLENPTETCDEDTEKTEYFFLSTEKGQYVPGDLPETKSCLEL